MSEASAASVSCAISSLLGGAPRATMRLFTTSLTIASVIGVPLTRATTCGSAARAGIAHNDSVMTAALHHLLAAEGAEDRMLVALEDVNHADAAPAHHVTEASARIRARALPLDLTRAGFAAQLQRRLPDLRQASGAAGVPASDEAAVGRHRAAATDLEVAALDALLRL